MLRFLGEKIEEDERIKTPQKSERNGVGLERIWRRKAAQGGGSGSAWLQPEVEEDTVAEGGKTDFVPGFISSAQLKEGGKTDFSG